jgi:hypothetical protein
MSEKPAVCLWDLRQAAKRHSEEGLNIILGCMNDPAADWSHRIRAVELLWAYGYGKPVQEAAIDVSHKFVIAPEVLPVDEWVATKGQGWAAHCKELEEKLAAAEGRLPAEKRTSESRSGETGHPTSYGTDIP